MSPAQAELVERATKELVAKGKIIEAGFAGLRIMAIAPDAPPEQVTEMRMAFFAGAQHLFGSIMAMMDPGEKETPADLKRMAQIEAELDRFISAFKLRHTPTAGGRQ